MDSKTKPKSKSKSNSKQSVPPPPVPVPLTRGQSRSTFKIKQDPPPIPSRPQSRSTFKVPPSPKRNVNGHDNGTMAKKSAKPPPKKPSALTHNNMNNVLPTKPPRRKPPSKKPPKHKKANSAHLGPQQTPSSPTRPLSQHPTIGEFYSSRARKNKLLKRQLPSKPKDVCIYFILMGKIYEYVISICLQHKLSQLLPKLSQMLASNEEILDIIMREVGRTDRSLSSISKKIKNNKINDDSTYDTIIKNPIFIYKNNTHHSAQTFIEIGYKRDLDKMEYRNIMKMGNDNDDQKDDELKPFIIILSCMKQEEDPFDLTSFSVSVVTFISYKNVLCLR